MIRYINSYKTSSMKTTLFKLITISLFLTLFTQRGFGQTTDVSVVALINFPDTAYEGQVYQQIGITLLNNDSFSFSGVLTVFIKGDSTQVDTLFASQGLSIAANDSATFFTSSGFQFDPGVFRAGSNIVVVWPVANGLLNPDTLIDQVFYVTTSRTNSIVNDVETFDAYPNPAASFLNIKLPYKSIPESVRIFDVFGRVLIEERMVSNSKLDISVLARGSYFILVEDRNGKRYLSRILKHN